MVVEIDVGDDPAYSDATETLPKAMVAATEIAPTAIHTTTTIPMPRWEAAGSDGGFIWGSWVPTRVSRLALTIASHVSRKRYLGSTPVGGGTSA
jgi:hypothetical protein